MQGIKNGWRKLPDKPRRVLTLILGVMLILSAGLIGWLPGPGGMVLFLLGIAVLASEFVWAERFRDWILSILKRGANIFVKHPYYGAAVLLVCLTLAGLCAYVFYTYIL
jgi:hypothetical protein